MRTNTGASAVGGSVRRRAAWRTALGVLAAVIVTTVVGMPVAASAESPVDFGSSDIVDSAGALGGSTSSVQQAIDRLQKDTGQTLLVTYVDSFSNPSDREQWAQQVRNANQLGNTNVLLAVAVKDRLYQLSISDKSPLQADSDAISERYIVPKLAQDDWAGAAIGAADGIRAASKGQLNGGSGQSSSSGSSGGAAWVLGILALIAIAVILFIVIRRQRKKRAAAVTAANQTKELERAAGSLLVQLDDALKTSEQEVGFAQAQFGDEAVKPFSDALATANSAARDAFAIKQKLEDAYPETPEQRAQMTSQITGIAQQAIADLDARSDDFDALRALDDHAVDALKTLTTDAETLRGRLSEARARITELQQRFEGETIATLVGNEAQADKLLAFATDAAQQAATTLSAPVAPNGHRPSVAMAVRGAQQSMGQAGQLLAAVDTVEKTLVDATAAVSKEIGDVQGDLAEARALVGRVPALAPPIAAAADAVTAATAQLAAPGRTDPVAMVHRLQTAEAALDDALAPSREEKVQREKAVALLGRTQLAAQQQIAVASDFIATRRGAVGSEPRQRLSEAQRLLDSSTALASSDPVQALTQAQRAQQLAASAIQLAQADLDRYHDDDNPWGGTSGGRRSGGGDAMTGAIIGGILGGLLGGGGGGGGGGWSGGGGFGGGGGGGFGGGGSGGRF